MRAASYAARSVKSRGAITSVGSFSERAIARPPAAGWSLITARTSIGSSPLAARSAMARMLLPRPEIRMTVGNRAGASPVTPRPVVHGPVIPESSPDDHAAIAAPDFADHDRFLAVRAQCLHRSV